MPSVRTRTDVQTRSGGGRAFIPPQLSRPGGFPATGEPWATARTPPLGAGDLAAAQPPDVAGEGLDLGQAEAGAEGGHLPLAGHVVVGRTCLERRVGEVPHGQRLP